MAEAFPISGNIDPVSFPHLLVDLHRHGATGSLKVTGPSHPKALYLRSGRILFGSSNDPRDQLGAILIESGKITREQLDQVTAKVGPGNPLAKVLADSGFVTQRELGDAARVKVERILADLLAWESGAFEFEDGVLPKGAVDLRLSTEKLLLAAVLRIPDRAFALRHVDLATVLEPAPEGEAALGEIRAEVWPLLERLDGQRTLKDAIALTRLDDFEAAKTACALLFLDIVRAKPAAADEVDLAQEAQSGFGNDAAEAPLFTVPLTSTAPPPPRPPQPEAEEVGFVVAPEPAAELSHAAPSPPPAPFVAPPSPVRETPASPEPPPSPAPVLPPEADTFILPPARSLETPPVHPSRRLLPEDEPAPDAPLAIPPAPPPFVPPQFVPPAAPAPRADEERADEEAAAPPTPSREPASAEPEPTIRLSPVPPVSAPPPYSPPSYSPPAAEPPAEEVAREQEAEIAPPSKSRPSQTDLAALDALLHPGASGRAMRAQESAPQPRRPDKWEPQFRPPQPARPAAARVRPRSSSRLPLVLTALAAVLVTSVAAWYYFLGRPAGSRAAAVAPPRTAGAPVPTTLPPRPTPAPTSTATAAAAPSPTLAPVRPTPAATPPARATASAPPTPRTEPPAAVARDGAPTSSAPPRGDAGALLRSGSLPEAARAFAASLAGGPRTRYSIQLLTACAPQTVNKAVEAAGGGELFITPLLFNGRSCYRVCWGVYADRPAAEAALGSVPPYYRQNGARPRVSPLAEILP
ncbi:MAG TPA: DUF4388 domain-containing protein [Vicinamibacteria bacterium]|nr:DUF4388 domain-containing protein [Vicinamibacteria bacterium]